MFVISSTSNKPEGETRKFVVNYPSKSFFFRHIVRRRDVQVDEIFESLRPFFDSQK